MLLHPKHLLQVESVKPEVSNAQHKSVHNSRVDVHTTPVHNTQHDTGLPGIPSFLSHVTVQ